MQRLLHHELAKPLALALILIGIVLIGFAIFRYAQTSYNIGQNFAFQRQAQALAQGEEIPVDNEAEARVLMSADMALRELVSERNTMVIVGGAGLIVLAVGWIANDLVKSATNKTTS